MQLGTGVMPRIIRYRCGKFCSIRNQMIGLLLLIKKYSQKFRKFNCKKLSLKLNGLEKLNEKAIDIETKKIIIDLDKKFLRPTEVDFLSDFSKARRKLKWKPIITTNELIEDMIEEEFQNKS